MKATAKKMIDEALARSHNGSNIDAAYKDKAFVEKISKRMPNIDNPTALQFYFKPRRAKDGLGELLGAATAPPIAQPERPDSDTQLAIMPAGSLRPVRRRNRAA